MRTPSCSTTRSTLRVETPLTYASWTTATSACSARRRGSRKLGKYPGPERSFGIASSIAPTRVSQLRSRYPLRCALRRSGARSPNSAPIIAETSASINASTINRTDSRITSACSEPINLSTACAAVILRPRPPWSLLRQLLGGDRRFETPGGRTFLRPALEALLHHFYRLDLIAIVMAICFALPGRAIAACSGRNQSTEPRRLGTGRYEFRRTRPPPGHGRGHR